MSMDGIDYPVRFEVDYPESSSRLLALLGVLFFIKILLLLPHVIVLTVLSIVSLIAIYVGFWAVLVGGRYPRGLFNFVAGVQQWTAAAGAWLSGVTDRYPPFSFDPSGYPARFEADYPQSSSRLLASSGAFLLVKTILLVPHLVILYVLSLIDDLLIYIGYWIVLIIGRYPRGLFDVVVGIQRWSYRVNAWFAGLTDRYPPLTLT